MQNSKCLPNDQCKKRRKNKLPKYIKDRVKGIFNHLFTYDIQRKYDGDFDVPPMFKSAIWEDEKLMQMKRELNELKSRLNDKEISKWHEHTTYLNPARDVKNYIKFNYKLEMCTQAWCKFYEILNKFPIAPSDYNEYESGGGAGGGSGSPYASVHICEAPGAFVTALNHFLKSNNNEEVQWQWLANTLNPYHEANSLSSMINDDRLILPTIQRWMFGADDTGDILNTNNIRAIRDEVLSKLPHVHLVTADGSIDCSLQPARQEADLLRLHLSELALSLMILSPGGCLVLKVFTLYEASSVCIMFLLNNIFSKVNVFKPVTSKGGNSEVYLVCENYHGAQQHVGNALLECLDGDLTSSWQMFSRDVIDDTFTTQHQSCAAYYLDLQMTCIRRNLDLYTEPREGSSSPSTDTEDTVASATTDRVAATNTVQPARNRDNLTHYTEQRDGTRPIEAAVAAAAADTVEMTCHHCKDMYVMRYHVYGIDVNDRVVCEKTNFHGNYRRDHGIYEERANARDWTEQFHRIRHHVVNSHSVIDYRCVIDLSECRLLPGPLVATVITSVFCDHHLLCEYNDLMNNCDWLKEKENVRLQVCDILTTSEEEGPSAIISSTDHHALSRVKNIKPGSNRIYFIQLSDFIETLKELKPAEDLIIVIPLCLRRYHISFIYLLCSLFNGVTVSPVKHSFEYCYLIGRSFKTVTNITDIVDYVHKVITQEVLQWLPMCYVMSEEFFVHVYKCNNGILRLWINALVTKEKELLETKSKLNST